MSKSLEQKSAQAAIDDMVHWLSDEHELGKAPAKIEVAGEFDYDDCHYFILKYKEKVLGKWMVGVCGVDEDGTPCGHTFSEFEKYEAATAQEKCVAMIEYLKSYWKNRARAEMERRGVTEEEFEQMSDEEWAKKGDEANAREQESGVGKRQGFVLLSDASFDLERLVEDLKADWKLLPEDGVERKDGNLVFDAGNNLVAVALMEMPVPDGEAEYFAAANYLWKEAVETTKRHKAHLVVFTVNRDNDAVAAGLCFSKVVSSCLNQKNALGVYTSGTVFQPEFYQKACTGMREGELPVDAWIYVGLISDENGCCVYTYGLSQFGKLEVEVIDTKRTPEEALSFLYMVSDYIIKNNMSFHDGETLSFTSEMQFTITKSAAVHLDGETFKIAY